MDAVRRYVRGLCAALAAGGVLCLLAAVALTVGDVALRRSVGVAVPGTVDLTQLCVVACVYAAMPYTFLVGGHVAVEVITERLPPRAVALCELLALLLSLALMLGLFRYALDQAILQHGYGDRSQTIGVPILFYWTPLLAGLLLSALACGLLAAGRLRRVLITGT